MLGGTGLLARDLQLGDCAFPPFTGSGSCSRENDRLQLRGSGGFSPRFPNIPPANCFTLVQPWTNIVHGLSHFDALKNSHRIATLRDLKSAGACPKNRNRNTNPAIGHKHLFRWCALEKESSPTLPQRVDSNRCGLGRSPGSRFSGSKQPSRRIRAPVACSP